MTTHLRLRLIDYATGEIVTEQTVVVAVSVTDLPASMAVQVEDVGGDWHYAGTVQP